MQELSDAINSEVEKACLRIFQVLWYYGKEGLGVCCEN